jgi:Spy/CpxP family protein refolding chaperone
MESIEMKKLFAALIAALFAAVTFSAVAADTAAPADSAKPAKSAKKHHKKTAKKVEETAPAKK